jgi:CheY-like chemotaxis protein
VVREHAGGWRHLHAEFAKIGEHAAVLEPGVRLLVCEDEVVTAAALREVLEDEGFIVDVAETLADAEQALRRADYACLVTDLKLPDGDGLTLIRRLRANLDVRRIPVIVVSGDAGRKRAQPGAGQLDIAAWMDKPVDPVRLKDAILAALAGAGRRPLILHVDDDPDMLQITAAALSGCGEVVTRKLAAARQRSPPAAPTSWCSTSAGGRSGCSCCPTSTARREAHSRRRVHRADGRRGACAPRGGGADQIADLPVGLARTVRRLVSQPPAERVREEA